MQLRSSGVELLISTSDLPMLPIAKKNFQLVPASVQANDL
jgi:hypothetical protein